MTSKKDITAKCSNALLDTIYEEFNSVVETFENAFIMSKIEVIDYLPIDNYFMLLDKIYFERLNLLVDFIGYKKEAEEHEVALHILSSIPDVLSVYNMLIKRANQVEISTELEIKINRYSNIVRLRANYVDKLQNLI